MTKQEPNTRGRGGTHEGTHMVTVFPPMLSWPCLPGGIVFSSSLIGNNYCPVNMLKTRPGLCHHNTMGGGHQHGTYTQKKPFSVKRRANMIIKSGKRDSNSRPQPWQGCALPTELFPHFSCYDFSEEEETRTPTSQLTLPPQSSASTNSATSP